MTPHTITIPADRASGLEPGDEYVCEKGRFRIHDIWRDRQSHWYARVEPLPPLVVEMPQKA